MHLSQSQLIRLWSELEQAYYGDNKYGGDTAEIYAYTVMEYSPTLGQPEGTFEDRKTEHYEEAAETLCEVLALFEKERGCKVRLDGRTRSRWLRECGRFDHRVRVRVLR